MALRDKLQALTAPCREADAEIAVMFQALPVLMRHVDGLTVHPDGTTCPHLIEIHRADGSWVGGFRPIPFTASLDATVELVEREIGWDWDIERYEDDTTVTLDGIHQRHHAIPAVAMLLALLDAKGIE